ncbi:MAG: dipeptidase [Clostridia bacterium]|nr:dipeptidase [Clostridia bacterium]
MKLFDLHSDTVFQMYKTKDRNFHDNPSLDIDLKKLRQGDSLVQCISLFTDELDPNTFDEWLNYAGFYQDVMAQYPDDLRMILTYQDMEDCLKDGKQGIMMTEEDCYICLGDLDRLNIMYDLGVRMCSICWNEETCFAYPNSRDNRLHNLGLKPLGREAIRRMEELGMVFDVSHLSRGGTLEALQISKNPIIASHSNARAVTDHPRNLSDEEIRGIADSGGVIGINLYPGFIDVEKKADLEKTLRHIEYLRQVGGDGVLAVGTDFDGFTTPHQDLKSPADMPLLYEALEKAGYSLDFIEGMFYKNAMRVFREVLK